MELFASKQQHIMQLYCSKQLNNAFRFFWKAMGVAYANPPFPLLAKVLTKIAYEGGRVVMCTPDWGCSGEHAYWRRMLDRMTVGRVQLPDGPIYVPEDSDTAMQAPEWASFLSIVEGSLNPVPVIRTYLSIYFLTLICWISVTSAPVSSIAEHCTEIRKLVVSHRSVLITC